MAMTTASAVRAFLPSQVGELVVQPVTRASVAIQAVGEAVFADAMTNSYRVPLVSADPTAAWTPEGEEIVPSDAVLNEAASVFYKLAGLTIISRELAEDSSPAAAETVGAGLARDIAAKLDAAFFGTNVTDAGPPIVRNTAQPAGLEDLAGFNPVDAGAAAWANADPFAEAVYAAEGVGASVGAFVANPVDALALAKVKKATGSNEPLLGNDPTQPTRRTLQGVGLLVSPGVTPGTVWGIPRGRVLVVLRDDVRLDVDRSAYFSSDRIGVRATLRGAFLYPHPAAVQKITLKSTP